MGDPRFERAVILLASHDEQGALGWVLNGHPVMNWEELFRQTEIPPPELDLSALVTWGGPVTEEQIWLIFAANSSLPGLEGQYELAPGIFSSASRQLLERLSEGEKLEALRIVAGYAGWGPGQLEREVSEGAWLPAPASVGLVFQCPVQEMWSRAYASLGLTPLAFPAGTRGSA